MSFGLSFAGSLNSSSGTVLYSFVELFFGLDPLKISFFVYKWLELHCLCFGFFILLLKGEFFDDWMWLKVYCV